MRKTKTKCKKCKTREFRKETRDITEDEVENTILKIRTWLGIQAFITLTWLIILTIEFYEYIQQ